MRRRPSTISRRALLGFAVLAAAGCHAGSSGATPAVAPPDPDAAALSAARAGELRLLESYDTAIKRAAARHRPPLQVARALHATHLSALGTSPPPVAQVGPLIHDLRQALTTSANTLRQLALGAHRGKTAATLASIAASHAAAGR